MAGRALLLVGFVLTAQLCGCTAYIGGGFSVEFIHRDSAKSPFHDPSLTAHGRVLAAASRSTARAAALARSYTGGSPDHAVSEMVSKPFEYLMYFNVGTPRTRMLVEADTGSDLVWLQCVNSSTAEPSAPAPAGEAPRGVVFDVSSSETYGRVGCQSGACHALHGTCDASSNCNYIMAYTDGSNTAGLLSTETFTFDDAPGGCSGCRERPQLVVSRVNFGCSTSINGPYLGNGMVGLGAGNMSLISQIGASTSLSRRFSYCLVPFHVNASSVLNFGDRAAVTEADAVTTPLVQSRVESYYTIALESVKMNNSTFTIPQNWSPVIVDSGTALTYLDKGIVDQMVEEVNRTIKLPQKTSPVPILQLCYDATGITESILEKMIPDVKLVVGGGAVVTLKAKNTFLQVDQSTVCMAVVPVGEPSPLAVIGSIAQQSMHVGYDLDKRTVTFASADCTTAYPSPPASL